MRYRIVVLVGAVTVALTALGSMAWGGTVTQRYAGVTGRGGSMSFQIAGGRVSNFTFENRCPGLITGTPVPAVMPVSGGRFAYRSQQFTITGRLLSGGRAVGTAQDVTGDCDSGVLHWRARLSASTVAPTPAQRDGILRAIGAPRAEQACLDVWIAASNPNYGTIQFHLTPHSCQRWVANGVSVFHRVGGNRWRLVFAGSSYGCPVLRLPRAVQRDLGVCPLA